ncbi:methyltransferase domain-containing protein [archaeon]|jgi:tRNA (adenine57-N1/adenine58-N1)-methyltransferase catalytic subunit|nr:methyltransferase domain-containing protein [archaeon]MBT4022188.1 methyltransferase domain-containing protein [archaeon]MBT4272801.1 methyltransferase domain-containing protein [archaeon]MBT4461600.1 methyltransferase domain-containing protein [archaeon]MBT4857632.1 methyltransferase domain-containing protein [archaeon]
MKILLFKDRKYLVRDESKDYHTQFGFLKSADIKKAKPGEVIKSNTGKSFIVIDADFIDLYNKIKRQAQIIPKKDLGLIITETGINKDSIVIESGAGSGAVGTFLAKICKKVYSYEIREDFYNLVKGNIEFLGIKNMKLKNKDAKLGFDEKNVDIIILDLPDPWELVEVAKKSLKPGGFLVSYSPTVPQVMDFIEALDKDFVYLKTCEVIERQWEVKLRKVRPRSQQIGHSGFLSFIRKIN